MKLRTVPTPSVGRKPTMVIPTPVNQPTPVGMTPGQRCLSKSSAVVRQQAYAMSALFAGIGLDSTVARDTEGEATLILQMDPKGPTLAKEAVKTLPGAPAVLMERSGVDLDHLATRTGQLDGAVALLGAAVEVAADADDSELVVATVMRQEKKSIRDKVLAYLPPEGMPMTDKQRRLYTIWKPVLELELKQQAQDAARQDLGKKRSKRRAAELLAQTQQEDLLKTIVDAKAGVNIDEKRAAQAVATWNRSQESEMADVAEVLSPAVNRRNPGR